MKPNKIKEMNTQDLKLNWNTKDDARKLKALKKLLKEWQDRLDPYFVMLANNIINNKNL